MIVKYAFGIPCPICKANQLGNNDLTLENIKNPAYMESWTKGEKSPLYWLWLKLMVKHGHINPDRKTPKKKRGKKK